MMTIKESLTAQLDREVERSRRALEQLPEGKGEWKPHDKSMKFEYLADMIATIPSWVALMLNDDSLDLAPKDGSKFPRTPKVTRADYLKALDDTAAAARQAFSTASDERLNQPWQLKVAGNVVQEAPRHQMIQETISHWSHHRGQMTVYLRLMGAKVPALFGPSADDNSFK
jgi:uncharacterized damage-inducible protein DinB